MLTLKQQIQDEKDGEKYANFNSDNLIKLLDKKDDKE